MNVDINLISIPQNLDVLNSEGPNHQTLSKNECDNHDKELRAKLIPDLDFIIYSFNPHHIHYYHLRFYLQQHEKNPILYINLK